MGAREMNDAVAPAADDDNADEVERAAMAVAADWQREQESVVPWSDLPEESRELARAQVRVVLAALANPAPESREADHSPGAGNMVAEADGVIEMSQEFSDGFNAGYNLASKTEAGQREGVDPIGEFLAYWESRGEGLFYHFGWDAVNLYNAAAKAERLASVPQPSIPGEVVQIGDDEEGQPRIVIHTTREAIRDYPASLLFKRVQVFANSAHSGGKGGGGSCKAILDDWGKQ